VARKSTGRTSLSEFVLSLAVAALAACSAQQDLGDDRPRRPDASADGVAPPVVPTNPPPGRQTPTDGSTPRTPASPSPQVVGGGQDFTCAVTATRTAKCWGSNWWGGLGNGGNQYASSATPVEVAGLGANVASIAVRFRHACALSMGGGVSCWGDSALGNGTDSHSSVPVGVAGLGSGVTRIAAGSAHTCALMADGRVKCWGGDGSGQLGTGTRDKFASSTVPVEVMDLSGVTSIAAGSLHTCALRSDGTVRCWGNNEFGQLGSGPETGSPSPIDAGVVGAVDLQTTDNATCVIDASGGLKCWGKRMGNATQDSWTPADLASLEPGGWNHLCGITRGGSLRCFGYNADGQLGDGTRVGTGPAGPAELQFRAAGGGESHTCGITIAGIANCWGSNPYGQLGAGANASSSATPRPVVGW